MTEHLAKRTVLAELLLVDWKSLSKEQLGMVLGAIKNECKENNQLFLANGWVAITIDSLLTRDGYKISERAEIFKYPGDLQCIYEDEDEDDEDDDDDDDEDEDEYFLEDLDSWIGDFYVFDSRG